MKIKLWQKFLLAGGTLATTVGATFGAIYGYSRSSSAKGEKHASPDTLAINLADLRVIQKYDMTFRDPVNSSRVVGTYTFDQNGEGKINGVDANKWIKDYWVAHKNMPTMYVYAGGVKFVNNDSVDIRPRDFALFIKWFADAIPWTPGLANLTTFSIKRGVQKQDGVIFQGMYQNLAGINKTITFYPDSFYTDREFNTFLTRFSRQHLTRQQVEGVIKQINEHNTAIDNDSNLTAEAKDSQKVYPYSAEKQEDGKYILYLSGCGSKLLEASKYLFEEEEYVGDLDISFNGKNFVTSNTRSTKVKFKGRVPVLSIYRAFADEGKFKGISTNFLKYVTAHEYGHMQTLAMTEGSTREPIALSALADQAPQIQHNGMNLDVVNAYLAARIPEIRAVNVSPTMVEKEVTVNGKKQKIFVWKTYQEAMAEWKSLHNSDPELKPNQSDYSMTIFEYKGDPSTGITNTFHRDYPGIESNVKPSNAWISLTIDKVFGADSDDGTIRPSAPTNANAILYQHEPDDHNFDATKQYMIEQIKANLEAGTNHFQFMSGTLTDSYRFARFLGISPVALFFINANDNVIGTHTPSFGTGDHFNFKLQGSTNANEREDITVPWMELIVTDENGHKKYDHDGVYKIKTKDGNHNWFSSNSIVSGENITIDDARGNVYSVTSESTGTKWFFNKDALPQDLKDRFNISNGVISLKPGKTGDVQEVRDYIDDFFTWFYRTLYHLEKTSLTGNEMILNNLDQNLPALIRTNLMTQFGWKDFNLYKNNKAYFDKIWEKVNEVDAVGTDNNLAGKLDANNVLVQYLESEKTLGSWVDTIYGASGSYVPTQNNRAHVGIYGFNHGTSSGFTKVIPLKDPVVVGSQGQYHLFRGALDSINNEFDFKGGGVKIPFNVFAGAAGDNKPLDISGATLVDLTGVTTAQQLYDKVKTDLSLDPSLDPSTAPAAAPAVAPAGAPPMLNAGQTELNKMKNEVRKAFIKKYGVANAKYKLHLEAFLTSASGLTAKEFGFDKLLDLMFIDPTKMSSSASDIYLNKAGLSDFIADSGLLTTDQLSSIRLNGFNKLFIGLKDIKIEDTDEGRANLEKIYTAFFMMNNQQDSHFVKGGMVNGLSGEQWQQFVDQNGNLDVNKFYSYYHDRITTAEHGFTTLAAFKEATSGTYRASGGNLVFPEAKVSAIEKWLTNPNTGYKSSYQNAFTMYTNYLQEILTRDLLQMTYTPSADTFRYDSQFTDITESQLAFYAYMEPQRFFKDDSEAGASIFSKYVRNHRKYEVEFATNIINGFKKFVSSFNSNQNKLYNEIFNKVNEPAPKMTQQNQWTKAWIWGPHDNYSLVGEVVYDVNGKGFKEPVPPGTPPMLNASKIKALGFTSLVNPLETSRFMFNSFNMNNGYFIDRWQRDYYDFQSKDDVLDATDPQDASFITTWNNAHPNDHIQAGDIRPSSEDWKIYSDNGNGRLRDDIDLLAARLNADGSLKAASEQKIYNAAEAYWWWLLRSYGAGTRTVASMWRHKAKDALDLWGMMPKTLGKNVKFIKAEKDGMVKYIPVKTKDTNNLFYLKNNLDPSSRRTLDDEGYMTWTTDYITAGTWADSLLENGNWHLTFVDASHREVLGLDGKNLLSIGEWDVMTENKKSVHYSPTVLRNTKGADGSLIGGLTLEVREQFAV